MLENINHIVNSAILVITSLVFAAIVIKEKPKITLKKVVITLLIISIYSIVLKYLNDTIKTLWICLLYIILYKKIFKVNYSEALFLSFMYIIFMMIPDTGFLLFLLVVLKIPPEICYEQYAKTPLTTLIICLIFIVMIWMIKKWLRKLIKIKLIKNKEIIIYTILTLICVVIVFYNATANIKILSNNLLISVIIMVVFVTILYSLIKQKIENNKVLEKYDKLLEFIKKYERIIEEQKATRHETKNQLITVKSKIENKEKNNIVIEYIDSLLNDYKSYDEEKYGKFQYLPANGIKGLFYYKAMEAEEKGIKLSINVASRVEKSVLKDLNTEDFKQLGRLIGVYLDNAIEASSISEEKKLGIEIYINKEDVIVVITNTYSGIVDTESVGKVRYSTKGNNRGYGLMLVNKILNSSKKFYAERQITDKLYIQKLTIKK